MTIQFRREMLQGRRDPLDRFVDRSDPLNRLIQRDFYSRLDSSLVI
jgi:hypothetical protein